MRELLTSDGKCPVETALELIDGKWKGVALYHLLGETLRFNELRRRIPQVTQRVLTKQLRELERDGLLTRTVFAEVPPRVEYRLTELGESLKPIILALRQWGADYRARQDHPRQEGGTTAAKAAA